ncbi:MAG: ABC transporter ATP-binding protein [bacterium]|nr:ABC transporter ATP-binding protein [bacterium]
MRMVLRYLRPQYAKMALQLTIKMGGTMVELLLPSLLSVILNTCARQGDYSGVWRMGALMLLCAALAWLGNVSANYLSTVISRDCTLAIRRDLFAKCAALSAAQRDRLTEASILSRLTSDTYNVHNMIDRMQRIGIRAPILLLGGIIVSFGMEPTLTLVLICTLPVLAVVVVLSSKKGVPLFTQVQQAQDRMVRKIQENMTGSRIIRALSCTGREQEEFDAINERLAASQRTADLTMAAVGPVTSFVLNAGLALVVLVGAWRVNLGVTEPGTIIAFLSYFTIILNALLMISRIFVMYSKGSASARRIEEVMELPGELLTQERNTALQENPPHVQFDHVTFSYNKRQPNVQDLSFSIRHGQTLGVIGPTGSGKSTLLALMLRLYDADSGTILLDGVPIQQLGDEELRSRVGVVFQNDFLMADTIGENIRFERDVKEDGLRRAIESAQAGFIEKKEGGLDFRLHVKGRNLSGGQQQRVLIARALADDPRLLLLDDCSSALDYRTDRELRRALRTRHSRATTVIVAQRVSAVMAADLILVMDGGRIAGSGTHEELMQHCPMYAELCRIQLGGDAA